MDDRSDPMAAQEPQTTAKECRICIDSEDGSQLLSPCQCSGSLQFVHKKCLLTWIQTRGSTECSICRTHYTCTIIIRRIPFLSFMRRELNQVLSFVAIVVSFSLILILCWALSVVSLNRIYTSSWSVYKGIFTELLNTNSSSLPRHIKVGHHIRRTLGRGPILYRDILAAKIAISMIVVFPLIFIWILFITEILYVWDQYLEYDIQWLNTCFDWLVEMKILFFIKTKDRKRLDFKKGNTLLTFV